MHAMIKKFRQACEKMAKHYPDQFQLELQEGGFALSVRGANHIGAVGPDLFGGLDDFDVALDLMGYECQIERVHFDAERQRFILDAGWTGKFWKLVDDGKSDQVVDTIPNRYPYKISVAVVILISAVDRESRFTLAKLRKKIFKNRKN